MPKTYEDGLLRAVEIANERAEKCDIAARKERDAGNLTLADDYFARRDEAEMQRRYLLREIGQGVK